MKSSKKYIAIGLLAVLAMGLPACNSKLEVVPGSYVGADQIKTESDVDVVMKGVYSFLQHADAFGEKAILMSDLLGTEGELTFDGTFNYAFVSNKKLTKFTNIPAVMWQRAYYAINNANLVIDNLDKVAANNKAAFEGEARFLRALTYFHLCNFFAKPYSAGSTNTTLAVPLLTKSTGGANLSDSYQPRATLDVVHKQIVDDLVFAAANLPATNVNGRATKYAASAILSRVYLAEGKYPEAAAAADAVITSGKYGLTATFDKAFNNPTNSSEDIFAIQQTSQSNAGTNNGGMVTFYAAQPNGRGDAVVHPDKFPVAYEASDVRGKFYYLGSGVNTTDVDFTSKWRALYSVITIVRLSEMYLTRAEANLRAGTTVGAKPVDDVNAVRGRSGASILGTVTADAVVDERIRELLYEGEKTWTYKRLKKNFGTFSYIDDKLIMPIPQREIDVNTKLEGQQNPGY